MKIKENKRKRFVCNINDVYAPYMPILTTGMVTLEDFASRQGWATSYGKKAINPRLYVKGRIDG